GGAPGQVADPVLAIAERLEALQPAQRPLLGLLAGQAVDPTEVPQVVVRLERQRRQLARHVRDVLRASGDGAAARPVCPGDDPHESGFTGAVVSADAHQIARLQVEVDSAQHPGCSPSVAVSNSAQPHAHTLAPTRASSYRPLDNRDHPNRRAWNNSVLLRLA